MAASGFYAFIGVGLVRSIFDLGEANALLWVGLPVFLLSFFWGLAFLPKRLRAAGLISGRG